MRFWQACHVAAVLLNSIDAKNIFSRFRAEFGPGAPGKRVVSLLVAFCEVIALSETDSLNRTLSNTPAETVSSVRSPSLLKGSNSLKLDQGPQPMHGGNHTSCFAISLCLDNWTAIKNPIHSNATNGKGFKRI